MRMWRLVVAVAAFCSLWAGNNLYMYNRGEQAAYDKYYAEHRTQRGRIIMLPSPDGLIEIGGWEEGGIIYIGKFDIAHLPYGPLNLNYIDEVWWNAGSVR